MQRILLIISLTYGYGCQLDRPSIIESYDFNLKTNFSNTKYNINYRNVI